jgi:hypothetical protein
MSALQPRVGVLKLITFVHAHPIPWKHVWPGACAGPDGTGQYYYPQMGGKSFTEGGRPSGDDWHTSKVNSVPGIMVDYDGIYLFDATNANLTQIPNSTPPVYIVWGNPVYKVWTRVDSAHHCSIY